MTNNWTDMANSSAFVIMGANPVENHPASFAHINAARAKGAKLLVIDPRKTRTACQVNPDNGDRYIRIRPGTDIAFLNGVVRRIIEKMDDDADTSVSASQRSAFLAYLNETSASAMVFSDGDATGASVQTAMPGSSKYTDARFLVAVDGTDYARAKVDASGVLDNGTIAPRLLISNVPQKAANVQVDPNTVYNRLKAHVEPYTNTVVAGICDCDASEVDFVAKFFIDHSRCSTVATTPGAAQNPNATGYESLSMLYAMGQTQHTYGSQNVKAFAVIQTLMGNMGRAGGGINALRGIHNVQGSTDMGNLYHLIPFYSGNPAEMSYRVGDATGVWDATGTYMTNGFGKYMDTLWCNVKPLNGTATATKMNGSYDDAYNKSAMGWQARGFYNMTFNFFGKPEWDASGTRAFTNALYDLWPKTNGDDHITMFRKAKAGTIGAMLIWGQNPAVTEPNQSAVRDGLKNLNMLAVVDMFETETAACDRKAGSVTYLIPASSHVEEAGSVTNSGRTLQWRERATLPKGNTKADLELMFRMAKAFDTAGCFSHITAVWDGLGITGYGSAYQALYGDRYGYTPGVVPAFKDVSGSAEVWHGVAATPVTMAVTGCEWFTEQMYQEMCKGVANRGTSWLYQAAYNAGATWSTDQKHSSQSAWLVKNKAKSRDNKNYNAQNQYPGWGYSWLVNRRVLYNNNENMGDTSDFFMGPDSAARLFVSTNTATLNYARWYRTIHRMADKPDVTIAAQTYTNTASPHFIAKTAGTGNITLAGRFPAHTEPYETPRATLATTWGRNTKGGAQWDLVKSDTNVAAAGRSHDPANFPFILTTIRCVEHFQGGPITRNNPWNVELEPEPWVEINSLDAAACVPPIKTGDLVQIVTARSNSTTDQNGRTVELTSGATPAASTFAQGFRARVGVGLAGNQRVGVGVVAIPWHWGDKGLSTGSRANDLCIDAGDANTVIPEYKACLCNIQKI